MQKAALGEPSARLQLVEFDYEQNGVDAMSAYSLHLARELAEEGNALCRAISIEYALRCNNAYCDLLTMENWCRELVESSPSIGYALMSTLYNPANRGYQNLELWLQCLKSGVEYESAICCEELAAYYLVNEPNQHSAAELRFLAESAYNNTHSSFSLKLLVEICELDGDDQGMLQYLKLWHKKEPCEPEPCIKMALKYMHGNGCKKNNELALKYFQKAANMGDATAMYWVGRLCYGGEGCRRNLKRAADYFRLAIENGALRAYYMLADMYECGLGVQQDSREALRLYQQGAEQGEIQCCLQMAQYYYMPQHALFNPQQGAEMLDALRSYSSTFYKEIQEPLLAFELEAIRRGWPISAQAGRVEMSTDLTNEVALLDELNQLYLAVYERPNDCKILERLWVLLSINVQSDFLRKKYLQILRLLAQQHPLIALMVGDMYYHGVGAIRNAASAKLFYKKAMKGDYAASAYLRMILGLHEEELKGGRDLLPPMLSDAEQYAVDARVCYMLGLLNKVGLYVPQNSAKAEMYFSRAAELHFSADVEEDLRYWQCGGKTLRDCLRILPGVGSECNFA